MPMQSVTVEIEVPEDTCDKCGHTQRRSASLRPQLAGVGYPYAYDIERTGLPDGWTMWKYGPGYDSKAPAGKFVLCATCTERVVRALELRPEDT